MIVFLILCTFIAFVIMNIIFDKKTSDLNNNIKNNEVILQSKAEEQFGMDSEEVDKIIDAGTLKDMFDLNVVDPLPSFSRFAMAQSTDSLAHELKWTLENFDYQKNTSKDFNIKITYNVSIINPDGDANKLFRKYDALSSNLKRIYKEDLKSLTTLPNNINFSKKYLTYPVTVEILEKNNSNGNNKK